MKIPHRQKELERFYQKHFPKEPSAKESSLQLSDDAVIKLCRGASNRSKFGALFELGDISSYDGDDSRADLALASMLAFYTQDEAQLERIFSDSALGQRQKWTQRQDYRRRTIEKALSGLVETYTPLSKNGHQKNKEHITEGKLKSAQEDTSNEEKEERKATQAELLILCSKGAELFHTPAGDSYATVPVNNHRETHPVKAKGFRRWLVRGYFEQYGRPPGNQALQDALGLLEARAEFDGLEQEVYIRVAAHNGNIYIDLANKDWEVVEITPAGWRVVSSDVAPVRFRRPRGMLALPTPRGGDGGDSCDGLLRRFINVSSDADLRLIVAWLIAALRPSGPYPVLLLQGEQGSAKSTAERLVRSLVDPSAAPLRTAPRSEHDLFIAADNAHVVAFDNISTLPPWLSDALCRLSTGGGFSTRTLYENREEELFDGMKPVILNGITDVATRPDLLDRALVVSLPPIPEAARKPEADLWREFEHERPAILAGLFDAVAGALRCVTSVQLRSMPRMADFAVWATAAEPALGWQQWAFMDAYTSNRQAAADTALDADPVAGAVLELMSVRDTWSGTATELWSALNKLADDNIQRTKAWPAAPNALAARLKRLAPTLRGAGIEYSEDRSGRSRNKTLKKKAAKDRHHRHNRHRDEKDLQNGVFISDGPGDGLSGSDGPVQKTVTPEFRIDKPNTTGNDGYDSYDDDLPPYSIQSSEPTRRLTEDEVQQVRALIHEGMAPHMARAEILKNSEEGV